MQRLIELALETVPRMLGQCDRSPSSVTAGCCDRNYWHYRLLDIPNARFQEAGLLFALAYATPHPANRFAGKACVVEWVRRIWGFWLALRNSDGSVSEVYPHERSFCATAFSTAAFLESVRLIGGASAWTSELVAVRNTLAWLDENTNPDVANQMLASWHALQVYACLTGDTRCVEAASRRRRLCLALQDRDGVWPEYGGLDTGYQTISMSILAGLLAMTPEDAELENALARADAVIRDRIAEDGTIAPHLNSRGTQYLYPHALARMNSPLMKRVLRGVENGQILRPTWLDDRYCHALASDYFLAFRGASC